MGKVVGKGVCLLGVGGGGGQTPLVVTLSRGRYSGRYESHWTAFFVLF